MACITTTPCRDSEMGCQSQILERWDSERLQSLAKQLRCYKPPSLNGGDIENIIDSTNNNNIAIINSSSSSWSSSSSSNITRIMQSLSAKERRAAVLICIFEGTEGELRVILTKRSMKLSSHPGEVALPGGKMDEGDTDDSATALREAMEEIGLDPALVEVVANLEPFISQHQLLVVPVVGLLPRIEDFKPALNADEVDAIFYAPLEMFLKKDSHRCKEREWRSWKYTHHFFEFESEQGGDFLIGGLTASILIRAASLIYQRPPSFTGGLPLVPDFQQLQKSLNYD